MKRGTKFRYSLTVVIASPAMDDLRKNVSSIRHLLYPCRPRIRDDDTLGAAAAIAAFAAAKVAARRRLLAAAFLALRASTASALR